MSTSTFISHLKKLPAYRGQIVHIEHIRPKDATYGELEQPLHPTLRAALETNHLVPLYSHQASAINAVRSGKNVAVVTPAASGKTLCYNIPVLNTILTQKGAKGVNDSV